MNFSNTTHNLARKSNKNFDSDNVKFSPFEPQFSQAEVDLYNNEVYSNPIFYRSQIKMNNAEDSCYSTSNSSSSSLKDLQSGLENKKIVKAISQWSQSMKIINVLEERFEEDQYIDSNYTQDSNQNCIELEIDIDEQELRCLLFGDDPDSSFEFLKFWQAEGYLTPDCSLDDVLLTNKSPQLEENEVIRPTKEFSDNSWVYMWKSNHYLTKRIYDKDQVRTHRMNSALSYMMNDLRQKSPYDIYTRGVFYYSEFSQNYKQAFEFFKIPPEIHQMLKYMTTKTKIEYLVVCEAMVREFYQSVCNEFLATGSVCFEKKAKLWNAYWYTSSLRDLYVFVLCIPLCRIKLDLLSYESKVKTKFNTDNIMKLGYWSLKQTDRFDIERYINVMTKREIEFCVSQYQKVQMPFDYRFSSLIDQTRKVGIILETYFKNGRIRDVLTGEEFEFFHGDLKYDNIDIIKIEKMMINKKVPVVLFTPLVKGVTKRAVYMVFLGTK